MLKLSLLLKLGFVGIAGFIIYEYSHHVKCSPTRLGSTHNIPKECYPEQIRAEQEEAKILIEKIRNQPAFICNLEPKPTLPADTQSLYQYALWHDLHWHEDNFAKPAGEKNFTPLFELIPIYHIAASNGNYLATLRLMQLFTEHNVGDNEFPQQYRDSVAMLYEKQFPIHANFNKSDTWDIDVVRPYADQGVIQAINRMGELSVQPNLLEYLSEEDNKLALEFSQQFFQCSAKQHSLIGLDGLYSQMKEPATPEKTMEKYQQYARFGLYLDHLAQLFDPKNNHVTNFPKDRERSQRYQELHQFFENYPFFKKSRRNEFLKNDGQFQIQIDDIKEIIPLPPAKLDKWNGKFDFQRWYEGRPPIKPTTRIKQLANKAKLNWQTGLPK
ncbi:DUF6396 domain-containing protein [Glaesserella sp.]|uniref:DUF6396 domain-containing protein n=1 Tax=Glaesserella sp. TaxID=2094731 RepID=UPI00359FE4CC